MKKQILYFVVILAISLILITCNRTELEKPQLSIQPISLFLTKLANSNFLVISNAGFGELSWEISDQPDWLETSKSSGQITSGRDTVIVTANINQELGDYSGTINITSNGGNEEVNISLNISMWNKMENMPTARMGHSSCVLNGKIYAIGGSGSGLLSPAYKKMEAYDPLLDTWTTKADMLTGRSNFSTCVVNGIIYAIGGGKSFYADPLKTIEKYDPENNIWTLQTDMPRGRIGLAVSVVNGKIFIIGGADANETLIEEVDIYDPATNTWITGSNLPTPRSHLAAVELNGNIYTIGGTFGPSASYAGLSQVEEYNPETDTWKTKAYIIIGRRYISACALNGKIYVFGGTSGNGQGGFSSVVEYDPAINNWTAKTDMPTALAGPSAATFNEEIYISGGAPTYPPNVVRTMYEYEPGIDSSR